MLQSIKPSTENNTKHSLRRLSVCAGAFLGLLILAVMVFGGAILNGYGKRTAERTFAQAYPGSVLRIGKLDYSVGANCLIAQSITLSASNTRLKVGRLSLKGVRWNRFLWGTAALADVFAKASLDATNLEWEFSQAHYGIRCARLRGSVPDSELIAERTELLALVGDNEFFAGHDYRTTRFHLIAPECKVLGLRYDELLEGKSYQARSVQFFRPTFEALVNCDKPVKPFVKPPLMVLEALAAIRQPLQVLSLTITNGCLRFGEQFAAGADPGVLTISDISMSAEGIANRGAAPAAIVLWAQGNLMEAGTGKVVMTIPITPAGFSLHYAGSLSAMDLTRLNPFLELDQHTRIKSGRAQEATFEIDVTEGQARGHVRALYSNLELAVLDKLTGTENGFDNRVVSFLANSLKIRSSNPSNVSGLVKEGEVNYTRRPDDEFQQFAWFALRTGVLDVISH